MFGYVWTKNWCKDGNLDRFNATDFGVVGDVNFAAVDTNTEGASIAPGTKIVALHNTDNDSNSETPFLTGMAANQTAELTSKDGADFFLLL